MLSPLIADLHMYQLYCVCCLTGHHNPECHEFTAIAGHGDYRDTLPTRTEDVAEQLASVVQVHMLCGLVAQCVGSVRGLPAFAHIHAGAALMHAQACSTCISV